MPAALDNPQRTWWDGAMNNHPPNADPDLRHEAAHLLGLVKSEAKARAARENGKRGGRPKGIPQSTETRRKISQTKRQHTVGREG